VLARRSGLEASRPHIGRQAARVLELLAARGPLTDHQLADALGLPLASINSTRHMLVKRGLVMAVDHVLGVGSALRTRWGLR
jgi:predicted ArsR family transcriptional regulator